MASSRAPLVTMFTLGVLVLASVAVKGTDTTPPWAIDWGPRGTNVSTETQVLIEWSGRMQWLTGVAGFSHLDRVLDTGRQPSVRARAPVRLRRPNRSEPAGRHREGPRGEPARWER